MFSDYMHAQKMGESALDDVVNGNWSIEQIQSEWSLEQNLFCLRRDARLVSATGMQTMQH